MTGREAHSSTNKLIDGFLRHRVLFNMVSCAITFKKEKKKV